MRIVLEWKLIFLYKGEICLLVHTYIKWQAHLEPHLERCKSADLMDFIVVDCWWSVASRNMQTLFMHYNIVLVVWRKNVFWSWKIFSDKSLISSVYSSWEVGKLQCFQWIKERFNSPNVRFCAIGDGWEECEAAEYLRWPFIKIDPRPGCSHRFPGLTLGTVGCYLSIVYGNPDPENDKE